MIGLVDRLRTSQPENRGVGRWLKLAMAATIIALLVWVIAFSPVLGARSVQVSGAKLLTAQQVLRAAAVRRGEPLVRLESQAIKRRVAALREVRSVSIDVSYPSTVTITVTERVAAGYRPTGGGVSVVDGDNVAFRTLASAPAGLPRLDASDDPQLAAATAQVAAALPSSLAATVALISAPTAESITLKLTDSRTIVWGGTDRNAEKARLLQALLAEPGTYFDLSNPDSVISRGAQPGN